MLMTEQAKKSPAFAQQLAQLAMFPMFFFEMPAPAAPMPEQGMAMPQGPMQIPGPVPVNPMVGGEVQLPTLEPQPNLEAQLGGPMPPIEPVRGL
jgi:hypothetical protein